MFQHEKIFVTVGEGRRVPLPVPGGGHVPAGGKLLRRDFHIERLLRTGDLVTDEKTTAKKIAETAEAEAREARREADAAAGATTNAPQDAAKVKG